MSKKIKKGQSVTIIRGPYSGREVIIRDWATPLGSKSPDDRWWVYFKEGITGLISEGEIK